MSGLLSRTLNKSADSELNSYQAGGALGASTGVGAAVGLASSFCGEL